MKAKILLPLFCFLFLMAKAQYWSSQGARSLSLCNGGVTSTDAGSAFNNQACLTERESPALSVNYRNAYTIPALGVQSACFSLPTRYGIFSLKAVYAGDKWLHDFSPGLAYAYKFSPSFSAGLALDVVNIGLSGGYGRVMIPTCEAGILIKLNKDLVFGSHVYNPVMARLSGYGDERLPTVVRCGFGFSFSEKLLALIEAGNTTGSSFGVITGLEYKPAEKAVIRAGFATTPCRYSFGLGIIHQKFIIDVGTQYQPLLGFTPAITLEYR